MAYTTAALVKTYLSISGSGDDTLIGDIVTRSQKIIDAYCRRTFEASGDTTRYFDPTIDVVGRTLLLDADLCAITTLTNGDGNVVSSGNYVKEPRNSTPYRALTLKSSATISWTYSTTPENSISILGKWAYSTAAPDDIVHATIRLASYLYRQKDNVRDVGGDIIIDAGIVRAVTLPTDVQALLAPYRRLVI